MPCRVCANRQIEEVPDYVRLPRVTSDCKPFPPGGRIAVCAACGAVQKPIDAIWQGEADSIYRAYDPYYQSAGVEQAIFDPVKGVPRRRSAVILDRLAATIGLGPGGSVLDVGCGNGALLAAFSEARPGWRLFGHDLAAINLHHLQRIARFETLHTCPLEDLPGGFDIITMMHSLEHFTDPVAGLAALRDKLAPGGSLLIQVPNIEATPFDLLIADHVSHFTRNDLARLLDRAGFGPVVLTDDWVTKEVSVVAQVGTGTVRPPPPIPPAAVMARVQAQVDWCHAVIRQVEALTANGHKIGVFGTSIAAMWLFGQFADHIGFFVDEDPSRRGGTLFDRPILSPDAVPAGGRVFVALPSHVARAVAARLAALPLEFHLPPDPTI